MIKTTIACDVCKEVIPKNKPFFQMAKQIGNDTKVLCHVCSWCVYRIAKEK